MSLHQCSEADADALLTGHFQQFDVNDRACYDVLAQYRGVSVIGLGDFGLTLKAWHDGQGVDPVVVKILPRIVDSWKGNNYGQWSAKEILKACAVDRLLADSPARPFFARTHGWIACGPPPIEWQRAIIDYFKRHPRARNAGITEFYRFAVDPAFYVVLEHGGDDLRRYRFGDVDECREFVWELAYALSHTHALFHHRDLYPRNVLAVPTQPREYAHRGGRVVTIRGDKRPMIIDFGLLIEGPTVGGKHGQLNDLVDFLSTLERDYAGDVGLFLLAIVREITQTQSTVTTVQEFLDYLIDTGGMDVRIAKKARTEACIQCGNEATRAFPGAPSYRFCGRDRCVQRMGPVAHIVAREL